jgi:MFS family permease
MTTTIYPDAHGHGRFFSRTREHATGRHRVRSWSVGLGFVGAIAVIVSAWGALVPFWGPTFGFSPDGWSSWHWFVGVAVLGVAPGAVGIVVGLFLISPRGASVVLSRLQLLTGGLLALASGAWFAVGPLAWPVINSRTYLAPAAPFRTLEVWLGTSIGPGFLLAMCGAFALGWAVRHDRPLAEVPAAPDESDPVATVVPEPAPVII